MANNKPIYLLFVLLVAGCAPPPNCEDGSPSWTGGLYAVWEPPGEPIGHLILHQGHDTFDGQIYPPANLIPAAEQFAAAGYVVYGLEMPPMPHKCRPQEDYLRPVEQLLDAIGHAYIVGLSGGGWTATLMAAGDGRIRKAYSVAGDAPRDVWNGPVHYEQQGIDYRALYKAAGDRLLHIYNFNDPCCFPDVQGDIGYPYVVDYTTEGQHMVSPWAVRYILADITGSAR